MGGMAETLTHIHLTKIYKPSRLRERVPQEYSTVNRNYYDTDRRNRENRSPSLKLVPFRKNRPGLPFIQVNQVFKEVVEAGLLDGGRRLHFIGRLQTIDASAGAAAAAGHRRHAHP
jgi:hypothetical protein